MSTKYQKENDTLGYYVEGDYMAEEAKEDHIIYISPTTGTGFKLEITSNHSIMITGPNGSHRSYTFDSQEDWETFLEKLWSTENYIPMKRTDFIEFFEALRFTHHYHSRNLELAKRKLIESQREVSEQEEDVTKLIEILIGYEEVYNESKV